MSKELEAAISDLSEVQKSAIRLLHKIKDDCPQEVMVELMEELIATSETFQNGTLINEWVLCQSLIKVLACHATNMVFKLSKELNYPLPANDVMDVVIEIVLGGVKREIKDTIVSSILKVATK